MTSEVTISPQIAEDASLGALRGRGGEHEQSLGEASGRGRTLVSGLAKVVEWLLYILLFILPLDPYLTLPGHSSGLFLSQLLLFEAYVVLALTVVVARLVGMPSPFVLRWTQFVPLGLVVCAGLLSLVGAAHRGVGIRDVAKYACYLGIFVLACAVSGRPNVRMRAFVSLVLGFGFVLAFGFIGIAPSLPNLGRALLNVQQVPSYVTNTAHLRAASTFRYSDEFDGYLLLLLPIFIAFTYKFPDRLVQLGLGALTLVGCLLVFLTYTRSAYVVAAVVIPVLLLLLVGNRVAIVASIGAALVFASAVLVDHQLSAKLLSLFETSTSGTASRLSIWQWALQGFAQHPLFGLGPRHLEFQSGAPWSDLYHGRRENNAENSYLNVLVDIGIVGLLAVLAAIVGGIRRALAALRRSEFWQDQAWSAGTVGGMLAILLDATIHPTFYSWQVTGLLCALVGLTSTSLYYPRSMPLADDAAAAADPSDVYRPSSIATVPLTRELTARVVFLLNSDGFGDAQLAALNVATELQAQGCRVLVVCPPNATELLGRARAATVPTLSAQMGISLGRWRGYLGTLTFLLPWTHRRFNDLVGELAAQEPSFFVAPFLREQLLLTKLRGSRAVRAVWMLQSPLRYLPHRLLLSELQARLARRATMIVAASHHQGAEWHRAALTSSRVVIIPDGVPADHFVPAGPPLLQESIPTERSIGFVSRLLKGSGAQFLIMALPRILERHPTTHVHIAGTGSYERSLRQLARRLGVEDHVYFLGPVADTAALLRSFDVFVFPATDLAEPLPTIILEAAAAGVPVIASDMPSLSEAILNERSGVLVPPGDAASIGIAANILLDDPAFARSMGLEGRRYVQARYALPSTVRAFRRALIETEVLNTELPAEGISTTGIIRVVHRKRFLSHTALFLMSKLLSALATAVWTVLAAGVLSQTSFGDLMLGMGVLDIGAALTDVGLTTVATRETAQADDRELPALIANQIFIRVGLGCAAALVTVGVTAFLPFSTNAESLLRILGPCLVFSALSSLSLVFRSRGSLWPIVVVSCIASLTGIGLAVALAIQSGDAVAFAWVRLLTVAFSGIATLVLLLVRFRPRLTLHLRAVWRLLVSALPYGLSLALVYLYYRIDVPMLALLGGSDEVAVYTSAYRILDVLTLLPAAASAIALAEMAKLAKVGERKRLVHFAQQYLELAFVAGLFIGLALNLTGPQILQVLYRGRYDTSLPVFRILAWAATATLVTNVFLPVISALDKRRVLVIVSAVGLVVNVGVNLVLIPTLGPVGAAFATLLTEFVVTICYATVAFWHLDWLPQWRVLLAAFTATLAGLVGQLVLKYTAAPWWLAAAIVLVMWSGLLVLLAPKWVGGLLRPSGALRRRNSGVTTPLSEEARELARMEAETLR